MYEGRTFGRVDPAISIHKQILLGTTKVVSLYTHVFVHRDIRGGHGRQLIVMCHLLMPAVNKHLLIT